MGEEGGESLLSVLVLIAALDEEEGIGPTMAELKEQLAGSRFLVVDGNSKDRTVQIAKNLGADVVYQSGFGKGDALAEGLEHISDDVDYVVLTDADYTYPAEYVPKMIEVLDRNPQVGMVCGNRFNSHFHLKAMSDRFFFGNRIIAFAHNILNGCELRDPLTGLRVIRREILKNWKPKSTGFDIEVELNHYVEQQGCSIFEIPIEYRSRLGKKKLKLKHGVTILKRILTENIY